LLTLENDRLDYGGQLRVPPGYALHSAIATTFSLDLETLAAASLALTLDQTLKKKRRKANCRLSVWRCSNPSISFRSA